MVVTQADAQRVMDRFVEEWMEIPGVVGVGIGQHEGVPCVTVILADSSAEITRRIPPQIDSVRVVIQLTGEFRATDS